MTKSMFLFLVFACLFIRPLWGLEEDDIPPHICVLPVFFVPRGEVKPTPTHIDMVIKHLQVTQQCYKRMLKERDTFTIADMEPQILHDAWTLSALKKLEGKERTQYLLNRLFNRFEINRFNCPYVFLVIIMCPKESWPTASGRPINEGFNSGGGIAVFSSNRLDQPNPLIQGSFQHELGHAFNLVHVDSYGYDQYKSKSVMSYNNENYWSGYNPPKEPGILLPEEIRALSMNKRVFGKLFFENDNDIPEGYKMSGTLSRINFDSDLPGEKPYAIKVTSASGQVHDTHPQNIVYCFIQPNRKSVNNYGLVPHQMWMSDKTENGWIDVELEFPIAVRMNKIRVHSQCGGGLYPVRAIRAEADDFGEIAIMKNVTTDTVDVCFNEVKSRRWRLFFKPDESGQVVVRGLQFFSSKGEIFCHKIPTYLIDCKTWPTN